MKIESGCVQGTADAKVQGVRVRGEGKEGRREEGREGKGEGEGEGEERAGGRRGWSAESDGAREIA